MPPTIFKYKVIDTRSLKGLRQAERLQSLGWQPIAVTITDKVTLQKAIPQRKFLIGFQTASATPAVIVHAITLKAAKIAAVKKMWALYPEACEKIHLSQEDITGSEDITDNPDYKSHE